MSVLSKPRRKVVSQHAIVKQQLHVMLLKMAVAVLPGRAVLHVPVLAGLLLDE